LKAVVGITGASGVVIGIRLLDELLSAGADVHAIISANAHPVIAHEIGHDFKPPSGVKVHGESDPDSPLNSGSFMPDFLVVAPCTLKTLAGIATGYADNLLIRSAVNVLRTGRRLILVPRETPLPLSALEQMVQLRKEGALILPPMVAYYHNPASIADVTDYFVGKILDLLEIDHSLYRRWGENTLNGEEA